MNDDMILDIANFDFSLIDSDKTEPTKTAPAHREVSFDEVDDTDFFEDEEAEDLFDEEVEEDEEVAEGSTLAEIAETFDEIDDDFEFTIGGEKIAKKDIAEVVRTRNEMKEAYDGLSTYVSGISESEMRIQTYLSASMTETETRLRQIEGMLDNPERLTPSEVQKALVAKRDLMARQTELEKNASQIRAAEEERRQQIDMMKIRQTDATLKTSIPGYKGIQTMREVTSWAQSQGMTEASIRESMSPEFIKVLMDAKTYREKVGGKKGIRENAAKRVNAPRSMTSKPKAKSSVASQSKSLKAYEQAMKSGNSSAAFDFLVD